MIQLLQTVKQTEREGFQERNEVRFWKKIEIFHNTFSTSQCCPIHQPSVIPNVSATQFGRVGDRINLLGFKLKILIGQKDDCPNVNLRWVVFSIPKGTTITHGNVFSTQTNNVLLDEFQTETTKVLGQGYWRPNTEFWVFS